jgi:transposase
MLYNVGDVLEGRSPISHILIKITDIKHDKYYTKCIRVFDDSRSTTTWVENETAIFSIQDLENSIAYKLHYSLSKKVKKCLNTK